MKRRVRVDRILIILIAIALIIASFIAIDKFIFSKPSKIEDDNNKQEETEIIKEFSMDLVDYDVYKVDDVDFDFIVARFRIKDTKAINYPLASLYTDEKTVKVAEYQPYVEALEAKEYYVGALDIDFNLQSENNSEIFDVFIPVVDKDRENLKVYDAIGKNEFTFDLNENIGSLEDLKYSTGDDKPIQTDKYEVKVSNAYIENTFFKDGEEYTYPSTIQVYTFVINVNNITDESIRIEDAIFIPNASNEENKALDDSITSMKINNLINREIKAGSTESGALFFEMYNPNESGITYDGKLKIKFSNSDNWLSLETELK